MFRTSGAVVSVCSAVGAAIYRPVLTRSYCLLLYGMQQQLLNQCRQQVLIMQIFEIVPYRWFSEAAE